MLVRPTLLLVGLLLSAVPSFAQDDGEAGHQALNVFLDCKVTCDEEYLRQDIAIVNYVRDRTDADVHVLLTSQPTGAGGTEYTVQFLGVNGFEGLSQTLRHVAAESATADDRRRGVAETLKRGLVPFIVQTPLADRVRVSFSDATAAAAPSPGRDPWDHWVFRTTFGGSFSGERSNVGRSVRGSVSANRTTNEWKITVSGNLNYRHDVFELGDGSTFSSESRTLDSSLAAVKSINEHWSVGLVGGTATSTFLNYDIKARLASGLEYNVFPYSQSTTKILTVQYTVGANHADYTEETIFGRTSERLADHRLGLSFSMNQAWGSGFAEVAYSQFLNRRDQYGVGGIAEANVRLLKGLSFNAFATLGRTNDQIYLPRSGATLEETLLRQRQLATSYRYSITFGLAYSFGSIFNNIVNPRFGGGADPIIF